MKVFLCILCTAQAIRIAPNPANFEKHVETFEDGEAKKPGIAGRQRHVWFNAAVEQGLVDKDRPIPQWGDVPSDLKEKISFYGFNTPKLPKSYVESVMAMNHTKTFRYMFSGSFVHLNKYRKWLPGFVKKNFGEKDYFKATDATNSYKAMGEFDRSLNHVAGFRPKSSCSTCMTFDVEYWQKMVSSEFVVTPGGDAPYSFRFYESILAGAIPIINNVDTDWHPTGFIGDNLLSIGYQYLMTTDSHKADQKMVDLNYQKFIRYQTFIQGDNNPADDKKNGLYPTL